MSAFNPQNQKLTAADWQSIARESNAEVGSQFKIIGGVVLGLFAAAAASPITGLLVAGYFGYKAWQDTQAANRNDEAIDSYGCVAHLLKEADLRTYTRQIGAEKVLEEITFALENGYRVTPAALDLLEAHGVDVEAITSDAPKALPAAVAPGHQADEPQDAPAVTTNNAPGQPLEIIDLAKTLGRDLKPLIISAMPRTGKGILISHARRYAKDADPKLEIWVIDPKAHPSESGYWEGVDRLWAKPLDQFSVNDKSIAREIENFISDWRRSPARPKLLIFDELVLTEAQLPKWFKEFVPSLMKTESSSGETDRRYLWAITQSPLVSDMGLSGGNRSAFNFVAMGRPQTLAHLESAKKSGFVRSVPTAEDFKASPVEVLAYYSAFQQWVAIPEYLVPSPVTDVMPQNAKANLERLYQEEAVDTTADASEPIEKLSRYLQSKGKIDFRTLSKNWGRNHNFQDDALKDLLNQIESQGAIVTWGDGIIWTGAK